MASLLTNATALSALQTLSQTQKDLATTQNRISSGLRVAEASDNAVYWSIATTMKSDNMALGTVKDSLNLGASTLDVGTAALNSSIDVLNKIKSDLVSAAQPGADRAKIQLDVNQLQKQLKSISDSASFNGQNWLSQDSTAAGYNASKGIVASFTRDSAGTVSVGTIDIDTSTVKLYDGKPVITDIQKAAAGFKSDAGLIITTRDSLTLLEATDNAGNRSASDAAITALGSLDVGGTVRSKYSDYITALNTATGVNAAKAALNTAVTALVSDDQTTLQAAITAFSGAGLDTISLASSFNSYKTDLTASFTGSAAFSTTNQTAFNTALTNLAGLAGAGSGILDKIDSGTSTSIAGINISGLTDSVADTTKLTNLTKQVDAALKKITDAASVLGATKTRISLQSTFVSALQDSITKGVGSLIDADMNEESTRLQALQVQQQLGVQSLGIANQNSQLILKLLGG